MTHSRITSSTCGPAALALVAALAAPMAWAQGVAYVSSEKDNALTLVDLKTLAVTGTLPTCKRPRHLQRSAYGKLLLVACGDSHQADVIDLANPDTAAGVGLLVSLGILTQARGACVLAGTPPT